MNPSSRDYLAAEWAAKVCKKEGPKFFSEDKIKVLRPSKPNQKNTTDCGLFFLHYTEKILEDISSFLSSDLNLKYWFTQDEVSRKRGNVATLIRNLAEDQNSGVILPKLCFVKSTSLQGYIL